MTTEILWTRLNTGKYAGYKKPELDKPFPTPVQAKTLEELVEKLGFKMLDVNLVEITKTGF